MIQVKTGWNEVLLRGLRRENTMRAVVLYSGGIDSTATAILLKNEGYEVHPLFVSYGQISRDAEHFLAEQSVTALSLEPLITADLQTIAALCLSGLTAGGARNDDDAWLPARNTLLMVVAGIYAQKIDADAIAIGYGLDDNFVFGDNIIFHHQMVESLMTCSLSRPLKVLLPAMRMNKEELIEVVQSRGVLELTTSCWNAQLIKGVVHNCNKCANCVERNASLRRRTGSVRNPHTPTT